MPAAINTKEKTIIPNNLAREADEFDISAQPFLVVTLRSPRWLFFVNSSTDQVR